MHITVEDWGDFYLYWGTPDQTLDASGEAILTYFGHPPYRNKCVLVGKNILFGTMTASPPTPILMAGRAPVQTLITGAATDLSDQWQANPWCILAELLTHKVYGLGLPDSWFDQTSWQAEADRCAAAPGLHYMSPVITSLKKVRELVGDLLGYPDAFVFWSNLATLVAGHWPHGEAAPAFDSTNTVNRNCFVNEPQWDTEGWAATSNGVEVSYSDWAAGFKTRPAPASSMLNMSIVQTMRLKKVDRPYIVLEDQALAVAAEIAKIESVPVVSGQDTVQAEKAAAVVPGAIFLLTDDVLGVSKVQRCTALRIAAPPEGTREITHSTERGVSPRPYSATPDNPTTPNGPTPLPVTNVAVAQVPGALAGGANRIAVLASRSNSTTTAFEVWMRKLDSIAFSEVGVQAAFAVAGRLHVGADTETTTAGGSNVVTQDLGAVTNGAVYDLDESLFWKAVVIWSDYVDMSSPTTAAFGSDYVTDPVAKTITIADGGGIATGKYVRVKMWSALVVDYFDGTPADDLDAISGSLTDDEASNGNLLLFAFQAASPARFEVMSVRSVSAGDSGQLLVRAIRTMFGSLLGGDGSYVPGDDTNDFVFMIHRRDLNFMTHQNFADFQATLATMTLRLVPSNAFAVGDINDIYDPTSNPEGETTEFGYDWNNIYAPTVEWNSLQANGDDVTDWTGAFTATDLFSFTFEMNDTNGDLTHGALVATIGQQELTLWASNFTPSATQSKTVAFQLPKGNWNIELRMIDASGNQKSWPLIVGGNLITIYVDNGTAPTAIISSFSKIDNYICGLGFGYLPAGLTVYYQLQNKGVALNPASWISLPPWNVSGTIYGVGDILPFRSGTKTVYAYCHQTGKFDSAPAHWNL
jgi:hypothetical protein